MMRYRWICAAAMCLGLAPQAEANEQTGLVHRASCTVVRFYVARYSASAAEMWARSHGATDAEIEAARQCLKGAPAQTAQAVRWTTQ
jgi:predicted outer membrane protein